MAILSKTIQYLKGSREEVKKIVWPTKKETINYSLLVIGISLIVALYLYGLDLLFNSLFSLIFA